MAPDGQSFNFGARSKKLERGMKKADAKGALPVIEAPTNTTTQITPLKRPSKKKSFAALKKLSIFNLRKQKSSPAAPQIILSDGQFNHTSPTVKRPVVDALSAQPKTNNSDSTGAVINSNINESYIPISPDKQVQRGPVPLPKPIPRRSIDSEASTASFHSFSPVTTVPESESTLHLSADGATSGTFDILLVSRRAPLSPASSFIESRSQRGEDGVKIMEISDNEDEMAVATLMPPSPPMSATYSYASFSEFVSMVEDVDNEESVSIKPETVPKLGGLTDTDLDLMKKESPITMSSTEENPSQVLSSVQLGKRPAKADDLDSSIQPFVKQRAIRDVWLNGPRDSVQTTSWRGNHFLDSFNLKSVESPSDSAFKMKINPTPGPSAPRSKPSPPGYGILAGLQEIALQERLLAEELRRIEEEDRKLAEELQRIEDEDGLLGFSTDEDEREWERILLIEDEYEVLRQKELERISKEDALLAKAMMEQEQADLEEEIREQERIEREAQERREREEREKRLAEERRIIFASREIGAPVGIRRVQDNGNMTDLDLKELNADIITQLKNVRVTFSTGLPAFRVAKVEWIINEKLRVEFENCKEQLKRHGRNTNEILLWHGTQAANINSIITGGFRVGGVNGHPAAHGSSMGLGIYSSTEAAMPVNSYNTANRTVIAFRALPGTISYQAQYTIPQAIGVDTYDSHCSGTVYVIRRPCQTLPCFLVNY